MPLMPVTLPEGVTLARTVGAVTISTWASFYTMGIVLASAYVYFIYFTTDRPAFKLLAALVTFIPLLDTVSNGVWAYDWTVRLWGSVPGSGSIPPGFYINVFCGGAACAITQAYYAWRMWGLGAGRPLVAAVLSCAAVQLGFVVYIMVFWASHRAFSQAKDIMPVGYGWIAAGLLGDALIVAFLMMRTGRSEKSSRRRVHAFFSRLVQTNFLSLLSQILTLVLFSVDVGMYFLFNNVVISKVYAFSLLTSLNARGSSAAIFSHSISTQSKGDGTSASRSGAPTNAAFHNMLASRLNRAPPPVVRVTQTIDVHEEDWDPTETKRSLAV